MTSGWLWIALGVEGVVGMAYWAWQVVGTIRAERAFTEACRAEEQAKTQALIEEMRKR